MKHKGFTLIEFIVILSIFAIMASVALLNFGGFRSSVSLNNLAHDIGLTVRQAQVFGWNNQSDSDQNQVVQLDTQDPATGNPVRYADGVMFSVDNPKQFILYRKANPNQIQAYSSSDDVLIDTISITGPNSISEIASALNKQDLELNQGSHGGNQINGDLSIAFTRPRPEAIIFEGMNPISDDYVGIYIKADVDQAPAHVVIISRLGEIDVQ